MGGDSADPIIAGAYAFGAKGFNQSQAVQAMEHGADTPTTPSPSTDNGFVERPGLSGYLANGYVPMGAPNVGGETASVSTDSASVTLEYAEDDFAISQLAQAVGKQKVAATFAARAQNWRHVFDPATHLMAPKGSGDAAPAGWPNGSFTLATRLAAAGITGVGQLGFQEGDAAQYTWMVPQNLGGLIGALGGRAQATADLEKFVGQLEAGTDAPFDWAGNEPDLGTPFVGDYTGAPWLTEQTTAAILKDLYPDSPTGEPGNDDLGAMSSWAVWAMLGLYPETPGTSVLVTTSPTFTSAVLDLGHGGQLTVHASGAQGGTRYISGMSVNGKSWSHPWLPPGLAIHGGSVSMTLVASPDHQWGSAPSDAPPSYGS
jgi:predicted alpha-1,2-mannosidase